MSPRPKLLRAPDAVLAPVPPDTIAIGLIPDILPPVMSTLEFCCTAMLPNPRAVLAATELVEPVPPAVIGNGADSEGIDTLLILPPVIDTPVEFWVDIEPNPRAVLAPLAVLADVPPEAIGNGSMPDIVPPKILTLDAF